MELLLQGTKQKQNSFKELNSECVNLSQIKDDEFKNVKNNNKNGKEW